MNPYEPPAAEAQVPAGPEVGDARKPAIKTWARRVAWLNIACAPGFVLLVTWYTLYDDSSMAGVLWVYSFPAAVVAYLVPGIALMFLPRAGWVLQLLSLGLSYYAAQMLLQILRFGRK